MRICLICEEHEGWGGIGTYTAVLARGLVSLGHRVHVITRSWEDDQVEEAGGVTWHHVPLREPSWRLGTRTANEKLYEALAMIRWSVAVQRKLRELHAGGGIEIVEAPDFHAQGLRPSLARSGPPVVVRLHTPGFIADPFSAAPPAGRLDRAVSGLLERTALRTAALVTSPSEVLSERVRASSWMRRPPMIVPHPIDEQLFTASARPESGHVVFAGRLERRKGVETLIDAVPLIRREVANLRLTLVGDDDAEGYNGASMATHLRERLARHGVPEATVEMVGAVPRGELPRWYERAEAFVVPSLFEGFPYVALEAMSCGRAVVASAVGGLPELIEHERDGLLVTPRDSRALADSVTRLLLDAAFRNRLGQAARAKVEQRYSQRAASAAAVEAYSQVLGR